MNKQQIIDYILDSPENTNPAILGQMIDEIGGEDIDLEEGIWFTGQGNGETDVTLQPTSLANWNTLKSFVIFRPQNIKVLVNEIEVPFSNGNLDFSYDDDDKQMREEASLEFRDTETSTGFSLGMEDIDDMEGYCSFPESFTGEVNVYISKKS